MLDRTGRSAISENYLEENRFLFIKSRLGTNELLLESFTGTEAISELFSFQLELLSENKRIKFEDILGQEIAFGVKGPDDNDQPRYMHGIVTAFSQLPDTGRLSRYRAIVSPRLWVLTQKQNCRIFQNLSTSDILKRILGVAGIDVAFDLQSSYQKREYCVQYRETDFNFISRLMEEDGIFYYFRHSINGHKLVIADSNTTHQEVPGAPTMIYDDETGGVRDENIVFNWVKTQELGPGKVSLRDYNFTTPSASMLVSKEIMPSISVGKVIHRLKVGGNDQFEIYDYPGRFEASPEGENVAQVGIQQVESDNLNTRGESHCFHMVPGYRFGLTRHPNAEGSYTITAVTHSGSEGGFHSALNIKEEGHYQNSFLATPYALCYRPQQRASKARVYGCQTAIVVGPSGEEIYTDKYGRVKVQFHWDRDGQLDNNSSCWVRCATEWAGKTWGTIHIPRIGQEVIVDFLEGDPDRPLIVGSVYNAQNMPPFPLPGDKTKSGTKSQSSKEGGGFNQIVFEDLKGSEEIIIHAQKDMNVTIEHDRNTKIINNESAKIEKNRTTEVGEDYITKVGKKRNINAGDEIVLETGSAKIVMQKSGDIKITGTNITISASASLKLQGGTVNSEASAIHTIKGSLVNIN